MSELTDRLAHEMNLTELKRLAEAATPGPWKVKDRKVVTTEDAAICCSPVFRIGAYKQSMANTEYFAAASPDVVLGLIKSLEHTTMAAESEAKEVDERNAVIDRLRTQKQALVEALKGLQKQYAEHPDAFWDWSKARAALALAEGGV